jgi:hypothetical protein
MISQTALYIVVDTIIAPYWVIISSSLVPNNLLFLKLFSNSFYWDSTLEQAVHHSQSFGSYMTLSYDKESLKKLTLGQPVKCLSNMINAESFFSRSKPFKTRSASCSIEFLRIIGILWPPCPMRFMGTHGSQPKFCCGPAGSRTTILVA